ncbi:SH3 domain-containing protein [Lyngbya sp. PCC 8106]|uniref:SH3 domain-containing protein n=1 Tax=Lyngbya sp. (strain PCC 8106) TaxID=313612 RepID=UPI0000EA991C|nr:SH3 domain-containing protein [Lyngbya sp. PCC 8106]EAW35200.1 hypothetical protein L8106_13835 [Lyngbya sp. PCC 8106]
MKILSILSLFAVLTVSTNTAVAQPRTTSQTNSTDHQYIIAQASNIPVIYVGRQQAVYGTMHARLTFHAQDPGGILNVRLGPGRNYPVIAGIRNGSVVGVVAPLNISTRRREPETIYRDGYTWVLVDVSNRSQQYRGWVVANYLNSTNFFK